MELRFGISDIQKTPVQEKKDGAVEETRRLVKEEWRCGEGRNSSSTCENPHFAR